MRIGVDIDQILADFLQGFAKFHNTVYDTTVSKEDFRDFNLCTVIGGTEEEKNNKILEYYDSEFFKSIPSVPGAREALQKLHDEHEFVLITSRPNHISETTKQWLAKHFKTNFKELHFSNDWFKKGSNKLNKGELCKQLKIDLMIEDSVNNATLCAQHGTPAVLLAYPWNETDNLHSEITRLASWTDIVEHIQREKKARETRQF